MNFELNDVFKIFYVVMKKKFFKSIVDELFDNVKQKIVYIFFKLLKFVYVSFVWTKKNRQI